MDHFQTMRNASLRAMKDVLRVRPGHRLLVITDQSKAEIGEAFYQAGIALGADGETFRLPETERPLDLLPVELEQALAGKDVVINAFESTAEETPFRVLLIRQVLACGARLGHCPGITASMMTDGPMDVDYYRMGQDANRLLEAFQNARHVHIQAPGGTDLTISIENRPFKTDMVIHPGTWGNLPAGEIWCAPVESTGSGVLVCDGCIGDLGPVPAPLTLQIEEGRIVRLDCADTMFAAQLAELTALDADASRLGELGIGLNPGARLTGNMLEDEKAFETAHIAFGNNQGLPGGCNHSCTHREFLFRYPTMEVRYLDGSSRVVIKYGQILV